MEWYKDCMLNPLNGEGRARRAEYWNFILWNIIVGVILGVIIGFICGMINSKALMVVAWLYDIWAGVAGIALTIRRLHDIGKSGWWWLIGLIPVVGGIVLLIFALTDSQPGTNQYGRNPKEL